MPWQEENSGVPVHVVIDRKHGAQRRGVGSGGLDHTFLIHHPPYRYLVVKLLSHFP